MVQLPETSTQSCVLAGSPHVSLAVSVAGIPDNALRLDVHALAGLYSCKIRSFDGYIQSINPDLKYVHDA